VATVNRLFGRRPSSPEQPRFYIYVSDAKVDMLFAQIPERLLQRFAAELTLDVKLLSIKVATREAPETRFSRVLAVTKYLRERDSIGSVGSGKTFAEAEAVPMRWGWIGKDESQGIVFFGGHVGEFRIFLTGSTHHVIGIKPQAPVGYQGPPGSYLPPLNAYYTAFEDWEEPTELGKSAYNIAADFYNSMGRLRSVPLEPLTFVARRIDVGLDRDGNKALIGSPIWVAAAET
jgi:hypothetical protein